jgi:AraC-like DNA-binding protein
VTEIDCSIGQAAFGVVELAEAMAMSTRTLNRRIGAVSDQTARDLIRTRRLDWAAQLLREGVPPMETAYRVGFDNPSSFSRAFREHFGQTPSTFQ